jgi:hypothetical protein
MYQNGISRKLTICKKQYFFVLATELFILCNYLKVFDTCQIEHVFVSSVETFSCVVVALLLIFDHSKIRGQANNLKHVLLHHVKSTTYVASVIEVCTE